MHTAVLVARVAVVGSGKGASVSWGVVPVRVASCSTSGATASSPVGTTRVSRAPLCSPLAQPLSC